MFPTSTSPGADIAKQMISQIPNAIENGYKFAAHFYWDMLISFLKAHWFAFILALFVVFVVVTLKAMMGRWGSLGSFLYNFFYFGVLFVVGLIWGPEIFVDDFFNAACTAILYPVCYLAVGWILKKTGLRRF